MVTSKQLKAFILNAELAWERVVFSYDRNTTPITIGEFDYYKLPSRFSTRGKIFRHYRQYWSAVYANRMICSAEFRSIRGWLYAPDADTGGLPYQVLGVKIVKQTCSRIIVDAVLADPAVERMTVRYIISRNPGTGAMTIILRKSPYDDYRYAPCNRTSAKSPR
ncbi:DL-endopeptidase inhibitor IseA family protein [Paenibacillus methanolicus]|uniref:IseA-like putative DL-endopeptidase inhibitor n=1 Tax=Paenibacillus methanolicus TaxID=582686 RepID=A0A5S5C0I2_9BACL|nr:DL-endopeptidase inhibitor IseA family protein [Paenibacillus methanolicus]TYP71966.1 IseA-like putative DL-endopeptidase inhibitor [Paenibacillus methanolicus]